MYGGAIPIQGKSRSVKAIPVLEGFKTMADAAADRDADESL